MKICGFSEFLDKTGEFHLVRLFLQGERRNVVGVATSELVCLASALDGSPRIGAEVFSVDYTKNGKVKRVHIE